MRGVAFKNNTWEEYDETWGDDEQGRGALLRLIESVRQHPSGGRPTRVQYNAEEFWSRQIDDENSLLYRYDEKYLYIHSLRGHGDGP